MYLRLCLRDKTTLELGLKFIHSKKVVQKGNAYGQSEDKPFL